MTLRPFIRYYGGKWRAAPLYPAPLHSTIVEPFAHERNHTSKAILRYREERGVQDTMAGWTARGRGRVASQVMAIKHWRVIEGDYTSAPNIEATWFVDPPYNNRAGLHYPCGSDKIDYDALGAWCLSRRGQAIVCENEGATWLPFRPFMKMRRGLNKSEGSSEAMWTNVSMGQLNMLEPWNP